MLESVINRTGPSEVQQIASEFDVEITPDIAESILAKLISLTRSELVNSWTRANPSNLKYWVKNRLVELGLLRAGKSDENHEGFFRTELNVFFTGLEETAEMLERLRRNEGERPSDKHHEVARSKIITELGIHDISPIDKTASHVAPKPESVREALRRI